MTSAAVVSESNTPTIGAYPPGALAELRSQFATTLDMGTILPADIRRRALVFRDQLAAAGSNGTEVALPLDVIVEDFEVWRWGLCAANLDLCDWYFGGASRYLGVNVRREFADSLCVGERMWHMDIEDRNSMKLIVYLNAVELGTGPFEYLGRHATERARTALKYSSGLVTDERMATVSDRSEWQQVIGPQYTAALADTCNLFHRAKPPVTDDRYSMTFSYCTARPYQLLREYLPNRRQTRQLGEQLTPRERAAIGIG